MTEPNEMQQLRAVMFGEYSPTSWPFFTTGFALEVTIVGGVRPALNGGTGWNALVGKGNHLKLRRSDMAWSRRSRLAGSVAVAGVLAAVVLVGASPANADITVDSAVCLNNATVYTENPNPVAIRPNFPYVYWDVTLPTACRTANASLYQTFNGVRYHAEPAQGGDLTESGTLVLTLQTSMSSRNLASFSVTVLNQPQ